MRNQSSIADLIVKGAIALVTAAFFIGAYLQFQVTFWLALIAALSVYITLLMLHALMRRSERVDALVSEVGRLEGEVARLSGQDAYAPPVRGQQARGPVAANRGAAQAVAAQALAQGAAAATLCRSSAGRRPSRAQDASPGAHTRTTAAGARDATWRVASA